MTREANPGMAGMAEHAVVGDLRHGVNRLAVDLVAHGTGRLLDLGQVSVDGSTDTRGGSGSPSAPSGEWLHVHFTASLFDARAWSIIRSLAHDRGRRLSVTLHDVPQPSDGAPFAARVARYQAVAANADLVVTNSRQEQARLSAYGVHEVRVIPLPIYPTPPGLRAGLRADPEAGRAADLDTGPSDGIGSAAGTDLGVWSRESRPRSVTVLGFVYPGKGHLEAISALQRLHLGAEVEVVALGGVLEANRDHLLIVEKAAAEAGVGFSCTGWLQEAELLVRAASAAVPLVWHSNISASGSLNTWLTAGRRPLVRRGPYTAEMAALRPGSLRLIEEAALDVSLSQALADPATTRHPAGTVWGPGLAEVAAAYRALWAGTASR